MSIDGEPLPASTEWCVGLKLTPDLQASERDVELQRVARTETLSGIAVRNMFERDIHQ